jgi:hypothetical protein
MRACRSPLKVIAKKKSTDFKEFPSGGATQIALLAKPSRRERLPLSETLREQRAFESRQGGPEGGVVHPCTTLYSIKPPVLEKPKAPLAI